MYMYVYPAHCWHINIQSNKNAVIEANKNPILWLWVSFQTYSGRSLIVRMSKSGKKGGGGREIRFIYMRLYGLVTTLKWIVRYGQYMDDDREDLRCDDECTTNTGPCAFWGYITYKESDGYHFYYYCYWFIKHRIYSYFWLIVAARSHKILS